MLYFLIGYMGSGKSSLGKSLARLLDTQFIDLDKVIESESKMSIETIFSVYGESFFRKTENYELTKLCNDLTEGVIAVGGGTPCFYDNIDLMNSSGITIFLDIEAGILVSRLINSKHKRPLIEGKSEEELKEYVKENLEKRLIYYRKSQITVSSKNLKASDIYEGIVNFKKSNIFEKQ